MASHIIGSSINIDCNYYNKLNKYDLESYILENIEIKRYNGYISTIKEIIFDKNYEFVYKIESLPKNITILTMNKNYNKSIDNIGNYVETLTLTNNFNQKINIFPKNLKVLDMGFLKIDNFILDLPKTLQIFSIFDSYDENCSYSKIKFNSEYIKIFIPICFKNKLSNIIIDYNFYVDKIFFVYEKTDFRTYIINNKIITSFRSDKTKDYKYTEEDKYYIKNSIFIKLLNGDNLSSYILLFSEKLKKLEIYNDVNHLDKLCTVETLLLSIIRYDIFKDIKICYLPAIKNFYIKNQSINNGVNFPNTIKILNLNNMKCIKIRTPFKLESYSSNVNNIVKILSKKIKNISMILPNIKRYIKFPEKINKLILLKNNQNYEEFSTLFFIKKILKNTKINLLITNLTDIDNNYTKNINEIILNCDSLYCDNNLDSNKISQLNF